MQRTAWRFIEFPISERKYGFQQEQARHRYIFKDRQLIESLGTENPTYRYTIPFREDISKGPYKHLFTEVYPEFLAACLDRTRGVLSDPVHGDVNCKLVSLAETLDINRRDGIDVEAEWIVAPLESEIVNDLGTQIQTLQGATESARRLDDEIKKVDWRQEQPPQPTVSPLDFVSSVGNQIEVAGGKVTAAVADAAFRLEKTNATIERLKDPNLEPLKQQVRRLQAALFRFEDNTDVTGVHPLTRGTTTANKSLSALAASVGMTVQEFIRQNPKLARSPLVPAGTPIRRYTDKSLSPKK